MRICQNPVAAVFVFFACVIAMGFFCPVQAEKVLVYDEVKGIIFVDKSEIGKPVVSKQSKLEAAPRASVNQSMPLLQKADTSLIRGKKKDPSKVYFESGLQFFKAANYDDALRQFLYADSTDPQAVYSLWIGKTYRQLGKGDMLLFVMKRILDTYPESDVADDAMFEMAFHYQTTDDYEKAMRTYTQLAEQFPFGQSYSNGEDFREVAKRQKQMMRGEVMSTLKLLGYGGEELDDMYKSFQTAKGLLVTGQGDQKTVKTMKQEYSDYLAAEEKKAASRLFASRYLKWAIFCGVLFFICGIWLVAIRMQTTNKNNQITELSHSIKDLDTRNL